MGPGLLAPATSECSGFLWRMGHHLRSLVQFVWQRGNLETHDNVPEDIRTWLYTEEQQYSDRKRMRRDSGSHPAAHPPMIINNYIPVYPSQTLADGPRSALALPDSLSSLPSPLDIPGLRDDLVDAYRGWHCSKVRSQDKKSNTIWSGT